MSKKSKNGLTRQGIRDLNFIKAPPAGIRLAEPPMVVMCKHPQAERMTFGSGGSTCKACGTTWDRDGIESMV